MTWQRLKVTKWVPVLISVWIMGICGEAGAQKENNVWVFGHGAGLDFNSGQPAPIQTATGRYVNSVTNNVLTSRAGYSSVSDRHTGALLFYCDSRLVFDRNHNPMPNGIGIRGSASPLATTPMLTIQGSLIVPVTGDSTQYYLFVLGSMSSVGRSLGYYKIDMKLNGGLGDVDMTTGYVPLPLTSDTLAPGMVAIPGENCDVWVICHEINASRFHAYHITANGVNHNPVISPGIPNQHGFYEYWITTLSASPDGTMLAAGSMSTKGWVYLNPLGWPIPYPRGLFLFRFDKVTGTIADPLPIIPDSPSVSVSGTEFSPDNTKLYAYEIVMGIPQPRPNNVLQYDIRTYNLDSIRATRTVLGSFMQGQQTIADFRRKGDTIYLHIERAPLNKINRISNPNQPGILCGFEENVITLSSSFYTPSFWPSWYDLGSDVVYPSPMIRTYADTTSCADTRWQSSLLLEAEAGHLAYEWDNGDTMATRSIDASGTYWVRYKTICNWNTDTFIVYPVPEHSVKMDTTICTRTGWQDDLPLAAENGYLAYEWDNGDTTINRSINAAGTYWVRYKSVCNWNTDTFIVHHTDISVTFPQDTVLCNGQHLRLEADVPGADFLWQDGSTEHRFTVTESGTYWLNVHKDICSYTDTVHAIIIPPYPQFLGNDTSYCNTDGIVLTLEAQTNPGAEVLWSTGSEEKHITISDSGVYWVSVVVPPCPAETAMIHIEEELCGCEVQMPTAFSPNGDGRNDVFRPVLTLGCPVSGYSLQVFNRWGERVFHSGSGGMVEGWDGLYKGLPAEVGVYYYTLRLEAGTEGKAFVRQGDLTLVR